MAHIGGSHHHHFTQQQRTKETEVAKKAAAPAQLDKTVKKRGLANPEKVMAQLNGKLMEAKKLKGMALRKSRRRRKRRKRRQKRTSSEEPSS